MSVAPIFSTAQPKLRTFDEEGVADFLSFGCTLEWRTLFKGMHLAPGGSLWKIENGECRKSRYFDPVDWESLPILPDDAFQARFQETFARLLPRYFASESDVGISLTGGLDTRMIMACSAWNGPRPVCYTFAGQAGRTLDARIAAQVAKVSGLEHRLLRISSDFLENFSAIADRTVYINVREINAVLTLEAVERTLLQALGGSSAKVGIGSREPATHSHTEVTR